MLPMLSRLIMDPIAAWVPAGLVILMAALGLTAAGSPPASRGARRFWMAAIFVCGSLAVAGTVWQAQDSLHRRSETTALLRQAPTGTAVALAAPQERRAAAPQPARTRAIAPGTAARLAAYLKKAGSRSVVVSAISGDIEAYNYANQLANLLRAAGWQVGGPESTRVFGDLHAVGVNVFANPTQNSDTAKILVEAFRKFDIPYEPRVTPSGVVPDSDAVELFVGALSGTRLASETPPGPDVAAGPPINSATAGQGSGSMEDKAGQQQ
jgi:hypothetical protein